MGIKQVGEVQFSGALIGSAEITGVGMHGRVDGPAGDELLRAKTLLNGLQASIRLAREFKLDRVHLDIPIAEELAQMLADSIKTAEQIKSLEARR